MQIVFRRDLGADGAPPGQGEIYIQPEVEQPSGQRRIASLVLEQGIAGLKRGAEPITHVVINSNSTNPTLDDFLAAEFVKRRLAGEELPGGCAPFAQYAALAREGLFTSTVPVESSLEGVFQAIRNAHGDPLDDPEIGRRVADEWSRMAAVIMSAAKAGKDPFTTPLFDGAEFARERPFLAKDNELYQHDVAAGRQWLVRLPGGPPRAGALLLTQPKSLLFKHWSRSQQPCHVGGKALLLIVDWGHRNWVLSTDPTYKMSLLPLVEQLQAAEAALDPARAKADPWFDGKPFHHTLIAAPRAGTRLSQKRVLGIVLRWARATTPRSRWSLPKLAAAALLVLAVTVAFAAWPKTQPPPDNGRGMKRLEISPATLRSPAGPRSGKDYALLFACDVYKNWPPLGNAEKDAREIDRILKEMYGFESHLHPPLDSNGIWTNLRKWATKDYGPYDQLFIYVAGHGDYDAEARRGFIVGSDSHDDRSERDPAKRYKSQVALSDLKEMFERSNCRHLFVVLDICYGGVIDLGSVDRGDQATDGVELVAKTQFIARKLAPACRCFLTSCKNTVTSDGEPGEHSPFAGRLIESLQRDGERDGVVTSTKIFASVDVPGRPEQPMHGTLPRHELGGDFLFIRR